MSIPPRETAFLYHPSLSILSRKFSDFKAEISRIKAIKELVALDSSCLPSICCYTFQNTGDNLNCVRASPTGEHIAAGFSDSMIKIWSLKDRLGSQDRSGSGSTLIGHSGPVYALDFSPDGDLILSASEDKSMRLWSTETKTNLVAYKGHNYPVFDVSFSSHGFYFASASYDKTARLWSCDHIFPLRIFAGHMSDVNVPFSHLVGTIPPQLQLCPYGFKRSDMPVMGRPKRRVCAYIRQPQRPSHRYCNQPRRPNNGISRL